MQAHPDKPLAERLHASDPKNYKDDNHKPEMACALTPFEAMCSFRPAAEIAAHVKGVPELRALIGEARAASLGAAAEAAASASGVSAEASFKAELKEAYAAIMGQPDEAVKAQVQALESRLRSSAGAGAGACASASSSSSSPFAVDPDAIALRLCGQFPGDVGILSPYLLNLVRLSPGQAIFLGANEPHAYLSGDCVEVMACSDNVVRAGLTPKFKDVSTLCSMLTYSTGRPTILEGTAADANTRVYESPVREFTLERTSVAHADGAYGLPERPTAGIIVVTEGQAEVEVVGGAGAGSKVTISEGQVWLQPAGVRVRVAASGGVDGGRVVFFRAYGKSA